MKRTLIVPATIALLTGMAATAQETNESAAEINTSAAIEAEADVNTDEMSVEELNALQLDVLVRDVWLSTSCIPSHSISTSRP